MFEFLSKLVSRRSSNKLDEQVAAQSLQKIQNEEVKQKNKEQERLEYRQKIDACAKNEEDTLALLLSCDFADGRYAAAQNLYSVACLEQALQATRNLDKRVAKLMQTRLEKIAEHARIITAAQACLQQADLLLSQEIVLANQLIELDKQVAQLTPLPAEFVPLLDQRRATLQSRLNSQMELQRKLLQVQQEVAHAHDFAEVDVALKLTQWKEVVSTCASSSLVAALPKNLLSDVQNKVAMFEKAWQAGQTKFEQTQEQSHGLNADVNSEAEPEAIKPTEVVVKRPKNSEVVINLSLAQIEELVLQFEKALEQGSIQSARQIEKKLQEIDTKQNYRQFQMSAALKERLNSARKELSNLMSWAKWSGNVSRDELISTAEKLTTLSLTPQEIVETVSALREQWKQMETKSGGAPKELWLRFDAACNLVYAPAALHFQTQADVRKSNLLKAEELLARLSAETAQYLNDFQDWKLLRVKILEMQQEWKKLGPVDRKDKARLESAFESLLSTLKAPLEQRQKEEILSREKMIAEVESLDATQKSSIDQLRSLQQRWQVQAASVSLQRKDEQKLWERFRAACDGVFEKKRGFAESADQQRQQNLEAKLAICQQLVKEETTDQASIRRAIDKANADWRAIGHVPRAQEQKIDKDFQEQIQRLQDAIEQLQSQVRQQKLQQFLAGLSLCQQLESAVESEHNWSEQVASVVKRWQELELGSAKLNSVLKTRFQFVSQISTESIEQCRQQLQENGKQWDAACLHLEILLGVDSPAALSAERLQKQIEVLQQALRSGGDKQQVQELIFKLVGLSVSQSDSRVQRLQSLIAKSDFSLFA
jgi:exonuclease SbcC